MTKENANRILYELSYNEYVQELKNKYGAVPKDYFYKNSKGVLTKTSKITRSNDGLYIHHVYECFFLNLSDPKLYELQCITSDDRIKEAQKAENLVYCNLIEHLMLHMKIALEYHRGQAQVGINYITSDLNRLYELSDNQLIEETYKTSSQLWKRNVYNVIKDDYDVYVMLCRIIINDIGIPKDVVCNITFYNYCYDKLYNILTDMEVSI